MSQPRNHRIVVTARGGPEVLDFIENDLPEPAARAQELLTHGRHAAKIVLTNPHSRTPTSEDF